MLATKFLFWLCLAVVCQWVVAAKKPSTSLWSDIKLKNVPQEALDSLSYLLGPDKNDFLHSVIKDILYIINVRVSPPKDVCKQRRFMVVQMASTSFEGLGSLLKQVQFAVAVSLHSDRTPIWGFGFPFMFEHSKDIWDGEDRDNLSINGETVNCTQEDPLAGPFGCFFKPLTTCSLADIGPQELVDFSNNPHNETARVLLFEVRKGIAMYHPPAGLLDFLAKQRGYTPEQQKLVKEREGFLWAAAVTAYVFRLKPDLVARFTEKLQRLSPVSPSEPLWGLHVRHGDLKALSNVYGYKEVFDFEDYFAAALQMSATLKRSPGALFVATDSLQADKVVSMYEKYMGVEKKKLDGSSDGSASGDAYEDYEEEADEDDEDDRDDYDEYMNTASSSLSNSLAPPSSTPKHFYNDSLPVIFSLPNSARYRTEHGSHTVAANGGCQRDEKYNEKGMRCALTYQTIIHYQTQEAHRSSPRAYRLMRVMYEAIEDLFFLSQCEGLVAQGSSHYSTLAALLIWAGTGARDRNKNVLFLDERKIDAGYVPTAFLHGMNLLNGTQSLDDTSVRPDERWTIHTKYFVTALEKSRIQAVKLSYSLYSPSNRIRLIDSLPRLPDKIFYNEASTWVQKKFKPVWPGQCVPHTHPIVSEISVVDFISLVINEGVEQLGMSHEGQALFCWKFALDALDAYPNADKPENMKEYRSIASENSATLKKLKYSEMVVNENHSTREFLDYQEKYMKVPGSEESRGMMSLEGVNDQIATLEAKLIKLKGLRDRLISANYLMFSGKIDVENKGGKSSVLSGAVEVMSG